MTTVTRARKHNVSAGTWSADGESIGQSDLTKDAAHPFGVDVFSGEIQKQRLSKETYKKLLNTLEAGEALDPSLADEVAHAMKDWAIERGATHYTHWFQPLTGSTAEKHDSFFEPDRDGGALARVLRQGADPGRAGRLLLPDRRPAGHLRGPRLHRLGSDHPRLHPGEPDGASPSASRPRSLLDRRGARQEDPAAALDGGAQQVGDPRPAALGDEHVQPRHRHRRPRAGVLPDRRAVLLSSGPT